MVVDLAIVALFGRRDRYITRCHRSLFSCGVYHGHEHFAVISMLSTCSFLLISFGVILF